MVINFLINSVLSIDNSIITMNQTFNHDMFQDAYFDPLAALPSSFDEKSDDEQSFQTYLDEFKPRKRMPFTINEDAKLRNLVRLIGINSRTKSY